METELKYMLIVQLANNTTEFQLREACNTIGVEYDRHEYMTGVYRLFANDKKDILFVLTRVKLNQL